jgi:AraC-like DNA-binding protein
MVSLANHGRYNVNLAGDNFGLAWRAARLYLPLAGELRFTAAGKLSTVGARAGALVAGWHPVNLACDGAQVLEVDIATERFSERDLLRKFKFAVWTAESCLASATAAALRELLEHPGGSSAIRAETNRVVEALIGSMLQVAQVGSETRGASRSFAVGGAASPSAAAQGVGSSSGSGSSSAPGAAAALSSAAVQKYISRKYTDAELNPAAIATHFNVSLRTLYRCFGGSADGEAEDGISKALGTARLNAALAKLRDPALADYTLDELAAKCGYRSSLALRRAVLAATGQTPSEIRAEKVSK